MMVNKKYIALIASAILVFLSSSNSYGQNKVEMADQMRADGKIYVVVAIILIVLIGLIAYLISLDRKVKKLENRLKD